MPKFIDHAVSHVRNLFPSIYETRTKRGSYHFSISYERTTIIAVGINNPVSPSPKSLKLARKFGLNSKIEWPMIHAEEDMIGKLIGMGKLSSSLKVVVLRINKFGELKMSLPCESCSILLKAYGLRKIWYSNNIGEIHHI